MMNLSLQSVYVVHLEVAVKFVTRHLATAHVVTTTYLHFAPTAWYTTPFEYISMI